MKNSRNRQMEAILTKAAIKRRGDFCTLPTGCQRCQGGWLDTKELHEVCFNPTARISQMRQAGWEVMCIPQASGLNLFHFVKKEAVQEALKLEKLVLIGDAPGGSRFYEVRK